MKRVSFWKMIGMNSGWVGLSFMWNSLHVILLPAVLLNFVSPNWKNTILGALTGLGLVIAMVVQPIAGALSDDCRSRWGRRRPFILASLLLDLLFLLVLGYAGGIALLAVGYLSLQICSNFANGALQGLMPDCLPENQLGKGSSIKQRLR
jgi:Na+/melibiose symporter-like transporter